MQIVIDIDEDTYKEIKKIVADGNEMCFMQKLIANGTPLPKGHGRLIDADTLWDAYHANDYDFYEALDDIPTIIEADTESER